VLFAFDDFAFDDSVHELRHGGNRVKAEAQVLELLAFLLRNPGRVVTKEELIQEVWHGTALGDNVISVCVAKLRKVLGGPSNRYIGSAYGRGYRFLRPVKNTVSTLVPAAPKPIRPSDTPFVGRSAALGRLQSALERAASGRTVACVLLGEAGIGKTRIAEVLEDKALAAGFRVSWGRCHAFDDVPPLWPFMQVVRSCETLLPPDLGVQQLDERESTTRSSGGDSIVRENRLVGAWEPSAPDDWSKTLSWMSRVVARVTAAQPWLIILEDLQWADAASLQLLAHVVTETAQLPLVILMTVRDSALPREQRSRRAFDYVLGHRDCERIELTRLQTSDVDTYVRELFGTVDSELVDAIVAKSEGNPFFMVELLRPFAHGPAPDPSELALSGHALEILRQTLRGFPPAALDVLSAAAVIGRTFDLGLLSAVTGHDGEALLDTLEDAMNTHVIVPARDSHTDFAFGHDLIRSVLYDSLPNLTRIRLHQRVGEALSVRQASSSSLASAELAHHLLSALPSGDVIHAVTCARRAARAANRVGAYADACAVLRRANAALRLRPETDPRTDCELLLELAYCERAAGEPAFSGHFDEAVVLARHHRFSDVLTAAGTVMSGAPGILATTGAADILNAALEALPESDSGQRAIVLAHLSWTPPNCADANRVAALLQDAQRFADVSGYAAKRTVLRAKLYFAGGPDDPERALAIAGEMERMLSARGAMQRARWSLEPQMARIVALVQHGDLAHAQRVVDTFGSAAHELHHAELIWHYERMLVVLRMNAGDFAYAKLRLTELKERAERLKLHARRAVEAIDWGELIGQTTDITPVAAELAGQLRPDASDCPNVRAYKLRALTRLGLLEEARAGLQAVAIADLYLLPRSRDYLATLGHLAFASAATGSQAHCAALYELLLPYPLFYVASLSCHCHGVVSHFLAILARTLGQPERALAHFEVALTDQARLGLLPQLAHTRFELAQMLSESSALHDRRRAGALLREVSDTASQLGMEPLRAAAERLVIDLERDHSATRVG
jgi:DNA-binding winged helix-turn-helix (wHTH) protein